MLSKLTDDVWKNFGLYLEAQQGWQDLLCIGQFQGKLPNACLASPGGAGAPA